MIYANQVHFGPFVTRLLPFIYFYKGTTPFRTEYSLVPTYINQPDDIETYLRLGGQGEGIKR